MIQKLQTRHLWAALIALQIIGLAWGQDSPPFNARFRSLTHPESAAEAPTPAARYFGIGYPPDTHGAVGPNHVVTVVNFLVRIHDKTGAFVSSTSLSSWWNLRRSAGTQRVSPFDPMITYDALGGRWIFYCSSDPPGFNTGNTSRLLLAVSQTSDPTGLWNYYEFPVTDARWNYPAGTWFDQPSLGFSSTLIGVAVTTPGATGDSVIVMNKADAYAGINTSWLISADDADATKQYFRGNGRMAVARSMDYSDTGKLFLIMNSDPTAGRYALSSIVENGTGGLTVSANYVSPQNSAYGHTFAGNGTGEGVAAQRGSTRLLDITGLGAGSEGITSAVYRNGSVWAAHTAFLGGVGAVPGGQQPHSEVQWLQVAVTTGVIQQIGRIGSESVWCGDSSIAVNFNNDALIGYSQSSATAYVGAAYSFRDSADTLGTMRGGVVYKAGISAYYRAANDITLPCPPNPNGTPGACDFRNRWGDYSATCVDPSDDLSLWTVQEYAETGGNRFGIEWARVPPVNVAAPGVTSSSLALGIVGQAFSFQITATLAPTSFDVIGDLPPGLSIDTGTGLISGTPTTQGYWEVTQTATNAGGSGSKRLGIGIFPSNLADAIDTTSGSVTTSGSADWFRQTATTHDGEDAARTGAISRLQSTAMETTVSGPGEVSFWWNASSEPNFDVLRFEVDGARRAIVSGEQGWLQVLADIGGGSHRLRWVYQKDNGVNMGQDAAFVDELRVRRIFPVAIVNPSIIGLQLGSGMSYRIYAIGEVSAYSLQGAPAWMSINMFTGELLSSTVSYPGSYTFDLVVRNAAGEMRKTVTLEVGAMDLNLAAGPPQYPLNTGGDGGWFSQTRVSHDGVAAAQSGPTKNGSASSMQFYSDENSAKSLAFWWSIDARHENDCVRLLVDGVQKRALYAKSGWKKEMLEIPAGLHEVKWEYCKSSLFIERALKDEGNAPGDETNEAPVGPADSAWVDEITLTAIVVPQLPASASLKAALNEHFAYVPAANSGATSFSISGSLPPGLQLNVLTGVISGQITSAGVYSFALVGQNSAGQSQTNIDITVDASGLGQALDDLTLFPTTGGDAVWQRQTNATPGGGDVARSGVIADNKQTWMEVTATGPIRVGFAWGVSSESGGDFLRFYLDGQPLAAISGEVPRETRNFGLLQGTHTLRWSYEKNGSISQGQDAGWVDNFSLVRIAPPAITSAGAAGGSVGAPFYCRIFASNDPTSYGLTGAVPAGLSVDPQTGIISGTPSAAGTFAATMSATNAAGTDSKSLQIRIDVPSLADAVDAPALAWTTGGSAKWFSQTVVTADAVDAAQSGDIEDNESSWIETSVTGPGRITFCWKVATERGGDRLRLLVDGVEYAAIERQTGFREDSFLLPAGVHAVRWSYEKNDEGTSHEDCGWLDAVTFVPAPAAPAFTSASTAGGSIGVAFAHQLQTSPAGATLAIESGVLPGGVLLNATSGLISGTPLGAGDFAVTLKATNDGGSGTQTLNVHVASSFEYWAASGGLIGPQAAPDADPDGDGLVNYIAWSLGLQAGVPNFTANPKIERDAVTGEIKFTFLRPYGQSDVIYEISASSDLVTWNAIAKGGLGWPVQTLGAAEVTEQYEVGGIRVIIKDAAQPPAQPRWFGRLQAVSPE